MGKRGPKPGTPMPAGCEPANRLNLPRLRRMVRAWDMRDYDVTLGDMAYRFGLKNRDSAKASIWYARQMLNKYDR